MRIYIQGAGCVSPQDHAGHTSLQEATPVTEGTRFKAVDPDYKQWIDAKMIRRMSRVVKMGVAAAHRALENAAISQPDMIITGTAYGCLDDTGVFLGKMVRQQEEMLTPTAFIQSTHNTVAGQIALMLQNNGYNNTFVHKGFSFESALLDSLLLLSEHSAESILTGGLDEITTYSQQILSRFGLYKRGAIPGGQLLHSHTPGTIGGEGAAFFVLGNTQTGTTAAAITGCATLYKPTGLEEVIAFIRQFLEQHQCNTTDVDLLLSGRNGDLTTDKWYDAVETALFAGNHIAAFKHLCGEYPTASAFALWLANECLRSGVTPPAAVFKGEAPGQLRQVLIYNCYGGTHHSLILLQAC